jgi:hypothetical protein
MLILNVYTDKVWRTQLTYVVIPGIALRHFYYLSLL